MGGWRGLRTGLKGSRLGAVMLVVSLCALVSAVTAGGTQPYETYESTVAGDGPVAQFRFSDAVGSSTIADSVGSYTATNNGVVLGGEGPFAGSGSGSFGGEAYASLPSDPLGGASAFTVEGWVDWAGGSASKQPVFALGSSSSNYMYLTPASALTSHMMLFEIHTSGGSDVQVVAPKMAANVWRYLAVTETSAGTLTLYVDGEQLRQQTGVTLSPSSLGSAPDAYLGRSVGGEVLFGGLLSNVAFYTKALSASQVEAHYDAGEYPVDTVLPAISGTAKDGNTLSSTKGTWTGLTPITFAYQWTLCNSAGESCTSVPEASEAKYTLGHEDVGGTLRVAVTGSNNAGSSTATSPQSTLVAPLAPSNTVLPVISGAAQQGQLLSASEGSWKGTPPLSYTYQWEACNSTGGSCKKITGATTSTYRVLGSQIGDTLRAVVTAENAAASKSATSEATAVITTGPPANTALPTISGTAEDGHTLSASTGSWAGTEPFSYTYQWELCNSSGESCTNISGATASTYALGPGDVGDTLRVLVTAKNSVGSTGATSAASGVVAAIPPSNTVAPAISGTLVDGQTLTASTGSWGGSPPLSYAYQWELCSGSGEGCASISGATSATYTLGHSDVGGTLRVKVNASNPGGSALSTSAASGVVAALAPSNTALPVISGTVRDGQTLSASTGEWAGTPSLSYAYQWELCNSSGESCASISGATSATYTLEHADVGSTLRVMVVASNAAGSAHATSLASGVVAALAPWNTTPPTISGTAQEGQTLSASIGEWEGTPPFSYAYQWERCNPFGEACLGIGGATSASYTVGAADVGSTLRVTVTASNAAGSASAASAVTGVATSAGSGFLLAGQFGSKGSGKGQFEHPGDVAVAANGDLWVLDTGNDRVEEFTAGGEYVGGFGSAGSGDGELNGPSAIALAPGGEVWVADTGNDRIEEFSEGGGFMRAVGSKGTRSGRFESPEGIAVDADGGVWVADTGNNRIQEFSEEGGFLEVVGSRGSEPGRFDKPSGVAIGANGDVWVADRLNDRVQEFSEAGAYVGEFGVGGVEAGEMFEPDGVVVADGYVWVGELGRDRVQVFSEGGVYAVGFGVEGSEGEGLNLSAPMGLAVDASGDVWVADSGNDRVVEWKPPRVPLNVALPEVNTVLPEALGFAQEGQALSATAGGWLGVPPISYGYQWERCGVLGGECVAISGATGSTYTPVAADVGHTLVVQVTATGADGGESGSATSMATGEVLPAVPVNTVAPSLSSSTPAEGVLESASTGSWATPPTGYGYQWERCEEGGVECVAIEGATEATYVPGLADVGHALRVAVTASSPGGAATADSPASAAVSTVVSAPVDFSFPEIVGLARQGQTLSVRPGTWMGPPPLSYAYQWERCDAAGEACTALSGATGSSYTPTSGDVAGTLRVLVSASDTAGRASQISPPSVLVEASVGNDCTDTWVGSSEGSWEEGSNWSSGSPPGAAAIACVGPGINVEFDEEAAQVGVLHDEGELDMLSGTLEVVGGAEASSVGTLRLAQDAPTLTGAGSIYVTGRLEWRYGTMRGGGRTVIAPGASGVIEEGFTPAQIIRRELVNEGTLALPTGLLEMSDGALLENKGTLEVNSEACAGACAEGISGEIFDRETLSPPAMVLNAGVLEKTQGTGRTTVAVPFTNDGTVRALSGTLRFSEGGISQQATTGMWGLEGGAIALAGGVFSVGESVSLEGVDVDGTASVERVPAPASTVAPSISGTAQAGQTLSAQPGSWSGAQPISYGYQWQRCNTGGEECELIAGAQSETYMLAASDIGASVRVVVTASDSYGRALAPSSPTVVEPPPVPSNIGPPGVSGLAQDAQTLTASTGEWSTIAPVSYSYQWESCNEHGAECAPVEAATGSEYQLTNGDIGTTLRVEVTATDPGGSTHATSATTATVRAESPSELQPPAIVGVPDEHQVLQADPGAWVGTETQYGYQWETCNEHGGECAPVPGATSSEYDLAEGDVGTTLRIRVGVHGAADSVSALSPTTPVIATAGSFASEPSTRISGAPQAGQVLTAGTGTLSGGIGAIGYTYQWQSCNQTGTGCHDIEDATLLAYIPASTDVGHRLRVTITAGDELGHHTTMTSQATQPIAGALAPVSELAPSITGPALVGQTLTARQGSFSGEGALTYTYQWQRCPTETECEPIEGATHSEYTPTEADVGDAILLSVSAQDEDGNTMAVSPPTPAVAPEPLQQLAPPSIAGTVQVEGTLSADPGIWSATGPVSYVYQWQRCNLAGAECTTIEGASEPTYTVQSADLGSTLRIQITATSPQGSKTALSPATSAPPTGEVSSEEAQEILTRTDPAVLAPSSTATLEEQSLTPALAEAEEELAAQGTLTNSTISKETTGEFAVNTPAGEISFAPVETSPHATTLPTVVNGAAALFANVWPATDAIVRPQPLGVSALLQIRSPEAAHSFSWQARLGPEQELRQLPDGAVAITEASEDKPASTPQPPTKPVQLRDTSTSGQTETSEEKAEAQQAEPESESEEEAPLPELPNAPQTHATSGEPAPGLPQPQNTEAAYETAKSAMSYAETQTTGNALAVIAPPTAADANGNTMPATLTVKGSTITLTIKPAENATYPLLTDTTIAAPTNKQSTERDPVHYGIADPTPQEPGHVDEHFEENGTPTPGADPNLFNGPAHTPRHIRTARLIVPYDILLKLHGDTPEETAHLEGYRNAEKHRLEVWLEKLKGVAATAREEIEPYITIGQDYVTDPCKLKSTEGSEKKCPQPTRSNYEDGVTRLMEAVIHGHATNGWPLVKLWGAWNEPDFPEDPLLKDAPRAAQFWEIANSALGGLGAIHAFRCPGCEIVAGEFSTYESGYTPCYRNVILYSYCRKTSDTRYYKRYWSGQPRDPVDWGFHDYGDLLNQSKSTATDFAQFARKRLHKPRLFMSEAGVELQDGNAETELGELKTKTEGAKNEKRELQQKAAETYLHLSEGLPYPIDRMYYYQYTAPTLKEQEKHDFDSALLEVEGGHRRERPAYCVLAYEKHVCPPTSEVEPEKYHDGAEECNEPPKSVQLRGTVNAEGAKTGSYYFEYGVSPSYGQSTGAQTLHEEAGSWVGNEVRATVSTTTGGGGCPAPIYFRIVATNSQASTKSVGQIVEFDTLRGN